MDSLINNAHTMQKMQRRFSMNKEMLGERISKRRKEKKMTQNGLSNRLGKSDCYIGGIERGHSTLSVDMLVAVAIELNISVDYLLQDSLKDIQINKVEKDIIVKLGCLNNEQKKYVLEMIKLFIKHHTKW